MSKVVISWSCSLLFLLHLGGIKDVPAQRRAATCTVGSVHSQALPLQAVAAGSAKCVMCNCVSAFHAL